MGPGGRGPRKTNTHNFVLLIQRETYELIVFIWQFLNLNVFFIIRENTSLIPFILLSISY